MLPVKNIPEQYLYRLLPQGVIDLDARKLMEAVMSGYQDRISDLRSYASKLSEIIQPDAPFPDLSYNVVVITFQGPAGQVISRSLDFQPDMPPLDDAEALTAWATDQAKIQDPSLVISVVAGTDLLRQVTTDTVSLLATNVGAILYPGLNDDTAEKKRRTRQKLLESHFPRLRIKGTADSFEQLGRIIGFDAVAVTPMWSRLVPHLPNDPGNPINISDFESKPEQTPSSDLPNPRYEPLVYNDGEYYTWRSGPLSEELGSASFWTSVNNRNPFLKIVQLGTITRPEVGRYVMSGGESGVVPSILLDKGTVASNLRADAIAAGPSFNGLNVMVVDHSGTAVGLEVTSRLSAVKYRSSLYAMKATLQTSAIGTQAVSTNLDLEANPTLTADGTAAVPFRPWAGGTTSQVIDVFPNVKTTQVGVVQPRSQAEGNSKQLSRSRLDAALRSSDYLESLRAATRTPLTRGVGVSVRDDAKYAAYVQKQNVVESSSSGTYSGTVANAPVGPKTVVFNATLGTVPVTTYVDQLSVNIISVAGEGFEGTYDLQNDTFTVVTSGSFGSGGILQAVYSVQQGTEIRSEPSYALKSAGSVAYSLNLEDKPNFSGTNVNLHDEDPWRRDLVIAGEPVDDDFYQRSGQELAYKTADVPYKVLALSGHQYEIAVLDGSKSVTPFRYKIINEQEINPITGVSNAENYNRLMLAEDSDRNQYHALLVGNIVVANQYWSPTKRDGLAAWMPFNEHPLARLTPYDRYSINVDASVQHNFRNWDDTVGWNLTLGPSDYVSAQNSRILGSLFSISTWLKIGASASTNTRSTIIEIGNSISVDIDNTYLYVKAKYNGAYADIGSFAITSAWSLLAIKRNDTSIAIGLGTHAASITWQTFTLLKDELGSANFNISGAARYYQIHDFSIWDIEKTDDQFELLRFPSFTKTAVAYPTTWIESLSRDNRYIFKLVDSGFAYPEAADVVRSRFSPGYAQRYNDLALYEGDPRFKQVGIGGGAPVQSIYYLGLRGPIVEGLGQTIVSGSNPALPGYTRSWIDGTGSTVRIAPPYDDDGGTVTYPSMPSSPWPNQALGNPAQDRIYVKGDDGLVYRVYADDDGSGVELKAERTLRLVDGGGTNEYHDEPTDAATLLATNGTRLSVAVSGTTYVPYEKSEPSQTFATPPVYLYRQSSVEVGALTDAYSRWANPNSFGETNGVAALDANGSLEFTNAESLNIGTLQLTFDVGNIGTVDDNFAGFSTVISLVSGTGSIVAQSTQVLLKNGSGENPRGLVSFNVSLDTAVSGPWLLTIDWNNALSVPRKGQKRQLAIYGYEIRAIAPALYQVSLNPLTLTPVNMSDTSSVRPGGLIAEINSYGTIAAIKHEALVFPEGSDWPLSNLLTTSTWSRRSSLRVVNPSIEPAPTTPTAPVASTVSIDNEQAYYNYGDTIVMRGTVSNPENASAYVWRFWDGEVQTTEDAVVYKVVTPGVGANFSGTVSMTVVDERGASSSASKVVPINRPPVVALDVTQDTGIFPYTGTITATVSDPDADSTSISWLANGTEFATGGTIAYTANDPATIMALVTDARGGVASRQISFYGQVRQKPLVSPIIHADVGRISNSNTLDFSVYALDPNRGGPLEFDWTFWNDRIPGLYQTGVTDSKLPLPDNTKDFHWSVTANSIGSAYNGVAYTLSGDPESIVTPLSGVNGINAVRPQGWYEFTTVFFLPLGTVLSSVNITGIGTADDYADIYVNGILVSGQTLNLGLFKSFALNSSNSTFQTGSNTLTFRVYNTPASPSPTYLQLSSLLGTMSSNGVTTAVENSNVKFNKATKYLADSNAGEKIVQVVVTDEQGYATTVQTTINLVDNVPPTITSVTTPSPGVLAGAAVGFAATSADDDSDAISYTWEFTSPRALTLYGGNVQYQTEAGDTGQNIEGTVTIDDGNGGQVTQDIPVVQIADEFLASLTVSAPPGFYQNGFVQTISAAESGVTIRYSLDGTEIFEETDGVEYDAPFLVSPPETGVGTLQIRARAFKTGFAPTKELVADYTFYNPNAVTTSDDPDIGTGDSTTNVAVVTIQSTGDTVIGTEEGADIPGDDGDTSVSPQSSVPEVDLSTDPSEPFAPLPAPGTSYSGEAGETKAGFVTLKEPI